MIGLTDRLTYAHNKVVTVFLRPPTTGGGCNLFQLDGLQCLLSGSVTFHCEVRPLTSCCNITSMQYEAAYNWYN